MNQGTLQRPYKAARQSIINGQTPTSRFGEDHLLGGSNGSQYYDIVDNCLDISRNTSIGRAVLSVMEDYVGGNGLTPVVAGDPVAQKTFVEWSNQLINVQGTKTLSQILRDLIVNSAGSGDVLITTPIDPTAGPNEVGLRVELTSGSRIRTPDDFTNGKKDRFGNTIKMGVAFRDGKEVGYYVQNLLKPNQKLSSRKLDDFTYIPRFDSETGRFNAFLFRNPSGEMAEQTRGLPLVFPVVQEVKDLSDLWDSAILGARNKNLLSVMVQSDEVTQVYSGMGGVDEDSGAPRVEAGTIIGDIVDGAITTMPSGGEIKVINSSGMIDLDALFLRSNRYLCSGIGIPMELLFKDFSQTNFSSGKLALDSFFRKTETWTLQISRLWTFLYQLVNIEANLKGFGVKEITEESLAVKFVGSQNFVDSDPAKFSKAEQTRIDLNITSATQELGRRGLTYDQILIEKSEEWQKTKAISDLTGTPMSQLLPQTAVENKLSLEEESDEPEEMEVEE